MVRLIIYLADPRWRTPGGGSAIGDPTREDEPFGYLFKMPLNVLLALNLGTQRAGTFIFLPVCGLMR